MSENSKITKNAVLDLLIEQEEIDRLNNIESDVDNVSDELPSYARIDQPNTFDGEQTFTRIILSDITLEEHTDGAFKSSSNKLMIGDYVLERVLEFDS